MADSSVAITPGSGANIDTYTIPGGDHRQRVIPSNYGGCTARMSTFRIPGRAGTTGQNLAAIWNASGSTINVDLNFVGIDCVQTAVIAATVVPPIVRINRMTTIPTNGTAGTKVLEGSTASSSSVTTYMDASADGTGSTTTLTTTGNTTGATTAFTQEFAPRLITAVGYEPADRIEMLQNGPVTLAAAQGALVRLDYTVATANPTTTFWIVTMRWEEYTP